jgi:hypothetical protein
MVRICAVTVSITTTCFGCMWPTSDRQELHYKLLSCSLSSLRTRYLLQLVTNTIKQFKIIRTRMFRNFPAFLKLHARIIQKLDGSFLRETLIQKNTDCLNRKPEWVSCHWRSLCVGGIASSRHFVSRSGDTGLSLTSRHWLQRTPSVGQENKYSWNRV